MELSQEFLIDMAINAGGYLVAGIISVLLYRIFKTKPQPEIVNETVSEMKETQSISQMTSEPETADEKKVEFITFGANNNTDAIEQKTIQMEEPKKQSTGRMNRKEAIQLAKKMLVAGATQEKIKKILPVSDSELALLSLNLK